MSFAGNCAANSVVYGVSGALAGLAVILLIVVIVVSVNLIRVKKEYNEMERRYKSTVWR